MEAPHILNVHTPTSSFSIVHTSELSVCAAPSNCILMMHRVDDDTLEVLFDRLTLKTLVEFAGRRVRSGWVKYSWNGSIWNLDDSASSFAAS